MLHLLHIALTTSCLSFQIQAGLDASPADRGVYDTERWNPAKPFAADKVTAGPCCKLGERCIMGLIFWAFGLIVI